MSMHPLPLSRVNSALRGAFWPAVLLLCGCAALPPGGPPEPAVAMPGAWAAAGELQAGQPTALVQWWSRFDDPLLSALVQQALQANTDVRGAQAALLQARALRDAAAAGLSPTLDASASAQTATSGGHSAGNSFRAGLDAGWELDLFGARRSELDASAATVLQRAANLGEVQISIAAEVALDYITLRGGQARLAIARDNLASQQETLQLTQWRLQAGLVSSLEGEQARAATEQTLAQLPALQTGIAQAAHALAVLTGRPPAALSEALGAAGKLPQPTDRLTLGIPADTLRQRPDVQAAEHAVTAAVAHVAQAEAARMPNFRLGGSLSVGAATLGALTSGAAVASSLLASVAMPLFDGGAASAQVRAQRAALDQARAAWQGTVLVALREVEDVLVSLRGGRERVIHLQQAAEAAASAALLARQRYGSGLVDFQTVLETQRNALSTQDNLAGSRADLSADHVRLYKALGGGWQAGQAPPPDTGAAARITKASQ